MASPKKNLQRLMETRDQLRAEMEALKHKIAGIDLAIEVIDESGEVTVALVEAKATPRTKRGDVKNYLLHLLEAAGTTGLNAVTAVEMAAQKGTDLDRGTISSLLSRFKRDGVVEHDGERYRLRQFTRTDSTSDLETAH